jgi:hypothetical protein
MLFRRVKRFVVRKGEGGYVRHSAGFGGRFVEFETTQGPKATNVRRI